MSSRPLPSGWTHKVEALKDNLSKRAMAHPELLLKVEPKGPRASGPHAVRCQFCRIETASTTIEVCDTCAGLMAPKPPLDAA